MLEIRNDAGLSLQLPADQRLTVEINSTIFDTDDIIRGSYSYPFKFGLNENNCRFIADGHLPEVALQPEMRVAVSAGPHSFFATLTYKTSGIEADAALLIDLGEITDQIRNTSLREFVTETLVISTLELGAKPTFQKLAEAEPNTYPVVFPPFFNSDQVEKDWKPLDSSGNEIGSYARPVLHNLYYPDLDMYTGTLLGHGDVIFVPMVYTCWLVQHICQKLGFAAQGTLFTDPVLSRLILFNTQSIAGLDPQTGEYLVKVGLHLGDDTIATFFKALRAYLGLSIEVDVTAKKVVFNTYRSLRKTREMVNISAELVPGSQGVDQGIDGGYVVNTYVDDADKYLNASIDSQTDDQFFFVRKEIAKSNSFTTGTKERQVSLEIGTTAMRMHDGRNSSRWLLPTVQQEGNNADPFFERSGSYSPYENKNELDKSVPEPPNAWGLRMLIYWGMQKNSVAEKYPFASSVSYDSTYNVIGDMSLQPGEPDDIWWIHQMHYYEFLSFSKKITALFRLSLATLSKISTSVPIGFDMVNFVQGRYLLEKFTYELPASQGFVMAKFQGRQLVPKILIPHQPQWVSILMVMWWPISGRMEILPLLRTIRALN
jgi:hypothetical protein